MKLKLNIISDVERAQSKWFAPRNVGEEINPSG